MTAKEWTEAYEGPDYRWRGTLHLIADLATAEARCKRLEEKLVKLAEDWESISVPASAKYIGAMFGFIVGVCLSFILRGAIG